MKHLLISLFLLFSLPAYSQLAESTLDSIITELQTCDQLKIKYDTAQSRIAVYKKQHEEDKETITYYKGTLEDYRLLKDQLEQKLEVSEVLAKENKKRTTRLTIGVILLALLDIILTVALVK